MKKIVFFCIPAQGHTNPTLGVVRELVRRGHQVWYYSYEPLRQKIEESGAVFVSCDDYDMEQKLTPKDSVRIGKDLAFSTRILVDTTLALDEKICRDMESLQPDCIVVDSMAVWGKAAAWKLGIPFVSSTTTFAFNQHAARIMPGGMKALLGFLLAMPAVRYQIRRLQKRGYPVRSVLDILQNDDQTHTIVYTSRSFQPWGETFPEAYYAFVGPSVRPAKEEISKTREKLVYISMGTVNNDLQPLYRACIEGLKDSPYQVILSVGSQVDADSFGRLPGNITVFQQVDQIGVLQKADVFLTHCGMNSASEALYHGVPLVMRPKTREQQGVANRVSQLKAGICLERETPEAILNAICQVLEDPLISSRAEEIGRVLRSCSGAAGAADKILEQCR